MNKIISIVREQPSHLTSSVSKPKETVHQKIIKNYVNILEKLGENEITETTIKSVMFQHFDSQSIFKLQKNRSEFHKQLRQQFPSSFKITESKFETLVYSLIVPTDNEDKRLIMFKTPVTLLDEDKSLSKHDLFNEDEKNLFSTITAEEIKVKLNQTFYTISYRILKNPKATNSALFLHGFGPASTWAQWLKLALPIYNSGKTIIMVDFPGFGRSSGARIQTRPWRSCGPNLIFSILDSFKANSKVTVVAQCGGAGFFLHALCKDPSRFAKRHVLNNGYTASWPENLEARLTNNSIKLFSTWKTDDVHLKESVPYKKWDSLRNANYPNVKFQDLSGNYMVERPVYIKGLSREKNGETTLNIPSKKYLEDVTSFLNLRDGGI